MPLVSVNEVSKGKQFPPERETERHNLMYKWNRYSEGVYTGLWDGVPSRLSPNLFAGIMDFWKQAVLGDKPVIEIEDNERATEWFKMIEDTLYDAAEDVVGDLIRYGVGLFISDKGFPPQSLDPLFWFPVRPAEDDYKMMDLMDGEEYADIVAYAYNNEPGKRRAINNRILVKVFKMDGTVERRVHKYEGTVLGDTLAMTEYMVPGIPIVPVRMSADFYGTSDYRDCEKYVAEMHRRESAISQALDKHANPHLAVPESSVVANADGSIAIDKEGMVIPFDNDIRVPPQYIVWDAKFDSQNTAIVRAENRILTASKISPILYRLSSADSLPNIVSGAALRRLSIPTVNKIKSIRRKLNRAFKDVIMQQAALYSMMYGEVIAIDPSKIRISWQPELSTGFTDDAEALSQLVGSGILTREAANKLVEADGSPEDLPEPSSGGDNGQREM